jgi:hypothetical protein
LGRKRWAIEGFFKTIKHRSLAASLRANHETWCLPLADSVADCLPTSTLDRPMVTTPHAGLESCQ